MRFEHVRVASVVCVDAPQRVASAELESWLAPALGRLSMPSGVLAHLSGIEARRFWHEETQPSDAAVAAGKKALEELGLAKNRIGLLISTSVCRDFVEPSTACLVHDKLGLDSTCLNFDVGNACLGFLNGMDIASAFLERGDIDYALIVDGESSRMPVMRTIERLNRAGDGKSFSENFATLTLGSGAAAMVLTHTRHMPNAPRYLGGITRAATEYSGLCQGQNDGMTTDGMRLLSAGVEIARKTFEEACKAMTWSPQDLDEVVVHQVSRMHTEKLAEALTLPAGKIYALYPEYGNVGPASVPMALRKAVDAGRVAKGARVGLMGIGSGLNCTMAEIAW